MERNWVSLAERHMYCTQILVYGTATHMWHRSLVQRTSAILCHPERVSLHPPCTDTQRRDAREHHTLIKMKTMQVGCMKRIVVIPK